MTVLSFLVRLLSRTPRPVHQDMDAWTLFMWGRRASDCPRRGRRDSSMAFGYYLRAAQAQAGLPVAAVFVWHCYKVGNGASIDPVAAGAWAQRATELGWPDVLFVPGDGLGDHGQEAEMDT
jgi:TPR repeat protein